MEVTHVQIWESSFTTTLMQSLFLVGLIGILVLPLVALLQGVYNSVVRAGRRHPQPGISNRFRRAPTAALPVNLLLRLAAEFFAIGLIAATVSSHIDMSSRPPDREFGLRPPSMPGTLVAEPARQP